MDRRGIARPRGLPHDGYLYITRGTKNATKYMTCRNYRTMGCTASGKITPAGEFTTLNGHHNHPREEGEIHAAEFKIQLQEACGRERSTLKNIYQHVALRNRAGAIHVPFNSVRSSMLRWRQATRPKIPANLEELATILETGDWSKYSNCTDGLFFSGLINAGGDHAVIFGNKDFIKNFKESQCTFINGTSKAVPQRPYFVQILTVFATCMDHVFPIIHIFMESQTRMLYDAVFGYLERTFPQFVNKTVITDYEVVLLDSLKTAYPGASLHGCFINYCQAILRNAKNLNLVQQIEGDERILLFKIYALALLPAEEIVPALESLQDNPELYEIFQGLFDYVKRHWINRITPQHFSVFRRKHWTNTVMESYHRRLYSKSIKHRDLWDLMDTLVEIQNRASLELAQLERGGRVFRITKKNVVLNKHLNEAWDRLANGLLNIGEFLTQAIDFVKGLDMRLFHWNRDIPNHEDPDDLPLPSIPVIAPVLPQIHPASNEPPPLHFLLEEQPVVVARARPLLPFRNLSINPQPPIEYLPEIPSPDLNEPPPLLFF